METLAFLSNDLLIKNPTKKMISWIDQKFSLDNPEFFKLQRMGYWTGRTPRFLCLYEKIGDQYRLPYGAWRSFAHTFQGEFKGGKKFQDIRHFDYQSDIKLYDYQERICQKILRKKNGIAVMPCGGGKTQTGLEAVARIGGRALWLTHTADLLNQSKRRAKTCYGCDPKTFGTITAGKVQIGESITFATVQTLSKIDLDAYRDTWDIIIVDECQHCAGTPTKITMFYKVLSHLSAEYKIGLTATPFRSDGLERSMYAILGEIIGTVTKEELSDRTCPVTIKTVNSEYEPLFNGEAFRADGTIDFAGLMSDLTWNEPRMRLVSGIVNGLDGPTLVLASRVDYLQLLQSSYQKESVCLSGMSLTKKNRDRRDKAILGLNSGELDAIFATYQLAKEGLDIPNLRYVVFATPEKDKTTVLQAVGRVARTAKGKTHGEVIDVIDYQFGLFRKWWNTRKYLYKEENYTIENF